MTPQEQDFCNALLPKMFEGEYTQRQVEEMLSEAVIHFDGMEMVVIYSNGKRDVFKLEYIPQLTHIRSL